VVHRITLTIVYVPESLRVPSPARRIGSLPAIWSPSASTRVLQIGVPFPWQLGGAGTGAVTLGHRAMRGAKGLKFAVELRR
jgi:hypothetical protein